MFRRSLLTLVLLHLKTSSVSSFALNAGANVGHRCLLSPSADKVCYRFNSAPVCLVQRRASGFGGSRPARELGNRKFTTPIRLQSPNSLVERLSSSFMSIGSQPVSWEEIMGSKPAARKFFKDIKAVATTPKGRFNEDMIILKAF